MTKNPTSVELFAGAGGLAIGVHRAGFEHLAVVEWDRHACATLRANAARGFAAFDGCEIAEADVQGYDFARLRRPVTLLAGGPPCQPFSLGGKHQGHQDERNMFPALFRAVAALQPQAILVENVKGLARASFEPYFRYIQRHLAHPEANRLAAETWPEHLTRLESLIGNNGTSGLRYRVAAGLLNAANWGVPQRRERVIIVGLRTDLGLDWQFPAHTHSQDRLLWDQWVTGEYWDRHRVSKRQRPRIPDRLLGRIERLRLENVRPPELPWNTVRDAIGDLPQPKRCQDVANIGDHEVNPGARAYPGHTGSPLDEPSKTLKAGDHGVPGGENMLAEPNGRVRYFSVRESARLQTFPDDYLFRGSWTEIMRQIGNAVPVGLAEIVAREIRSRLEKTSENSDERSRSSRALQSVGRSQSRP